MKRVIHWFRRDLRLTDNTALALAAQRAGEVVPVYIHTHWTKRHGWTGAARQAFLCDSLHALSKDLHSIGGRLIIRSGNAAQELEKLVRECEAEAIFFNRDPDPFGREMEKKIQEMGERLGLEIVACQDVCMHERDEVLTGSGEPYRVFTPYAKAWAKMEHPKAAGRLQKLETPASIHSLALPTLETWELQGDEEILPGGEEAARKRLAKFLKNGLTQYAAIRNIPAGETTSRISQDLRFGLLSIREVYWRCAAHLETGTAKERASVQVYLNELIWREFYMAILWHFPHVLEEDFNPIYRNMKWPGHTAHFTRWCEGKTGFPIVDAAMRQLNRTGFMHNRTRMIVAMFLTKDLNLHWKVGESYFMQKLVDGEIASNNGGWQWSAGTGADAAPYFRIQNPWTQTKRFDPNGEYIKKWVPELREVAPEKFCVPPMGKLAPDYPLPIVDHAEARKRTLDLFFAHWKTFGGT